MNVPPALPVDQGLAMALTRQADLALGLVEALADGLVVHVQDDLRIIARP